MRPNVATRTGTAVGILVLALGSLGACGSGDDDTATTTSSAGESAQNERLASDAAADPGAGLVHIVLGSSVDAELEITACDQDPTAEPDEAGPAVLLSLDAHGESADGTEVNLAVRRYRSAGASVTLTDTITVAEGAPDAPDRLLVAQRYEVDGVVTDARDPDADDPLLRLRGDRIEAAGLFGPPGAFAEDEGLVEGALVASCTGTDG